MKPQDIYNWLVKPMMEAGKHAEISAAINAAVSDNPKAYARDVLGMHESVIELFTQDGTNDELLLQIRFELQERYDHRYVIEMRTDKIEQLLNLPKKSAEALATALRVADPFIDALYSGGSVIMSVEADNDEDLRLVQKIAASNYESLLFLRDHCLYDLAALTIDAIRNLLTPDAIDKLCITFDVRRDNHPSSAEALAHWLMNRYQ